MTRNVKLAALGVVLLLVACGARDAATEDSGAARPAAPSSAAPVPAKAPAATLPDGSKVSIEVVADAETRAQGLMFRPSMGADHGMLFIFPATDIYPFWMKNTLIPLDMIWIDEGRKVVHVARGVPPCAADPCPSYSPDARALYVLELAAGQADARKITTGSTIAFEGIENFTAR